MPSSEYYRRQSEFCLQLALLKADLYADLRMTFWLLELAKELRAKADEADGPPTSVPTHVTFMMGPRQPPGRADDFQ